MCRNPSGAATGNTDRRRRPWTGPSLCRSHRTRLPALGSRCPWTDRGWCPCVNVDDGSGTGGGPVRVHIGRTLRRGVVETLRGGPRLGGRLPDPSSQGRWCRQRGRYRRPPWGGSMTDVLGVLILRSTVPSWEGTRGPRGTGYQPRSPGPRRCTSRHSCVLPVRARSESGPCALRSCLGAPLVSSRTVPGVDGGQGRSVVGSGRGTTLGVRTPTGGTGPPVTRVLPSPFTSFDGCMTGTLLGTTNRS